MTKGKRKASGIKNFKMKNNMADENPIFLQKGTKLEKRLQELPNLKRNMRNVAREENKYQEIFIFYLYLLAKI